MLIGKKNEAQGKLSQALLDEFYSDEATKNLKKLILEIDPEDKTYRIILEGVSNRVRKAWEKMTKEEKLERIKVFKQGQEEMKRFTKFLYKKFTP